MVLSRQQDIEEAKKKQSHAFKISPEKELEVAWDIFLLNSENKKQFIDMLREKFTEKNVYTTQALADADRLIVETAIYANNTCTVN